MIKILTENARVRYGTVLRINLGAPTVHFLYKIPPCEKVFETIITIKLAQNIFLHKGILYTFEMQKIITLNVVISVF
jgi:hypothetical protein